MKGKRVKPHHLSRAVTKCSLLKQKNTILFNIKSRYFALGTLITSNLRIKFLSYTLLSILLLFDILDCLGNFWMFFIKERCQALGYVHKDRGLPSS